MATYEQLQQQYQDQLKNRSSLESEQARLANEAGVTQTQNSLNGIRNNIVNTQRMLEATPNDVMSRARRLGGPATSAVINRLTQARQDPLTNQLNKFSQTQGVQQQALSDMNNQVLQKLGLIQTQRSQEDAALSAQVDRAFQAEQHQRDIAAQQALARLQAGLQAANQAKALKMQQQAEIDKQNLLAKLFGTGGANGFTGTNSSVLSTSTAKPNNMIIDTAPQNPLQQILGIPSTLATSALTSMFGGARNYNAGMSSIDRNIKQNAPFVNDFNLRLGDLLNGMLNPTTQYRGYYNQK